MSRVCEVDECARPVRAHGLCNMHHQRWTKHGRLHLLREPADCQPIIEGSIARVPLTQGRVAVIDASDVDLVAGRQWFSAKGRRGVFYAQASLHASGGGVLHMHRLILSAPDDMLVDHVNGDGLDNRRSNLRLATTRQNNSNRSRLSLTNSSGYDGVGFRPARGKWRAYARVAGQNHWLGHYRCPTRAALARDAWLRENDPSDFRTYNIPLLPGERGITEPQGATA